MSSKKSPLEKFLEKDRECNNGDNECCGNKVKLNDNDDEKDFECNCFD